MPQLTLHKVGKLAVRLTLVGLVVLVAAFLLLALFFDPLFRVALEGVEGQINGEIKTGPASLRWNGFVVRDLQVVASDRQPVIEASQLRVKVSPWALTKGNPLAAVRSVEIDDLGIRVVVDDNGQVNLLSVWSTPVEPVENPLQDFYARIELNRAWVLYKDVRGAGFLYELADGKGFFDASSPESATYQLSFRPRKEEVAKVKVFGEVGKVSPSLTVQTQVTGLPLDPFSGHPGFGPGYTFLNGAVSADVLMTGNGPDWADLVEQLLPLGEVEFHEVEVQTPQMPTALRNLRGKVSLFGSTLETHHLMAELAGTEFQISGKVNTGPGGRLEATLKADSISLPEWAKLLKNPPRVEGTAQLDATAEGPTRMPRIDCLLTASDVVFDEQKVERLFLRFGVRGDTVRVENLEALSSLGEVTGDGWVFLDDEPRVVLNLRGRSAQVAGISNNAVQTADFDLRILGGEQNPLVYGRGRLDGLGSWSQGFQGAQGSFLLNGSDLFVTEASAERDGSVVHMPFAFVDGKTRDVQASVSTENFRLATDVDGRQVRADVSGSASVVGNLEKPESLMARGRLTRGDFTSEGNTVQGLSGSFLVNQKTFIVPDMEGRLAGGDFSLAGVYDLAAGIADFNLRGSQLNLSQLGIPVSGRGDVDASLRGPLDGRTGFRASVNTGQQKLASVGFRDPDGSLGLVAWMQAQNTGQGPLEAVVTAQGRPDRLSFAYNGKLESGTELGLDTVELLGDGLISGGRLRLDRNLFAWTNPFAAKLDFPVFRYSGRAYSFFGPQLAGPLEKRKVEAYPFPERSVVEVSGSMGLASQDLALLFKASGLDVGWLAQRPWLDGGSSLNDYLNFRVSNGLANANGQIRGTLSKPELLADLRMPWLQLRDLDPALSSVTVSRAYSLAGKVKLTGERVELSPLLVSSRAFDSRLSFRNGERLPKDPGLNMALLQGWIGLDNDRASLDLRVRSPGWKSRELALFVPASMTEFLPYGNLETENLHLWGPLWNPSASGLVALQNGGLWLRGQSLPVELISLDFSSQSGEFRVANFLARSGPVTLTGAGARRRNGTLVGDVWADDVPLEHLHRLGAPFTGLSGKVDLALSMAGDRQADVFLGLEGEQLGWNPKAIGGEDAPTVIDKLVFGKIERNGERPSTGPDGGVRFNWGERWSFLIPDGSSRLSFEGTELSAAGKVAFDLPGADEYWKDWFVGQRGPDFGSAGGPFRAVAENLTDRTLERLLGYPLMGEDTVLASGTLEMEGQWYRDHLLGAGEQLPNYRLSLNQMVLGSNGNGARLEEPVTLAYQRQGERGDLILPSTNLSLYENVEGEQVPAGRVEAEGKLALMQAPGAQPESELFLAAFDLPLRSLGFLSPGARQMAGHLSQVELNLSGPLLTPDMTLLADVKEVKYGPFQVVEGGLNLTGTREPDGYFLRFSNGAEKLSQAFLGAVRSEKNYARLSGELELDWKKTQPVPKDRLSLAWLGRRPKSDSRVDLLAEVRDEGLDFLASLLPGEEQVAGLFRGNLKVQGTVAEPELQGEVAFEEASIRHKDYGDLTELNMLTRFARISGDEAEPSPVAVPETLSRYSIEKLEGRLGGEKFSAQGKAELTGLSPTYIDVHFKGENLGLSVKDLFRGRVSLDLAMFGKPWTQEDGQVALVPSLGGKIAIPDGDFYVPLGAVSSSDGEFPSLVVPSAVTSVAAPAMPVEYDVALELGDNFWAHALDSRVRAKGDLRVVNQDGAANPLLIGDASLSRGSIRIPFYDASFRLRTGIARWQRSLIPNLEGVEAMTDLGGYRIIARVDGTYPDLNLELVSDPPLPQAELSRLVVLGGLPSAFNNQQVDNATSAQGFQGFLASQGVSFISGILTNRLTEQLGKALFLSEISFEIVTPSTYAVKLAKAIDNDDDFLLTLTRIIRQDGVNENLYGIEWRFLPNFLLRTAFDQLGTPRFWFQTITRF